MGLNDSRIVEPGALRHAGSLVNTKARPGLSAILLLMAHAAVAITDEPGTPSTNTVRVAAVQEVPALGLAANYSGDAGIASDPAVLFADNFESGDMKKWDQQRGRVVVTEDKPSSGRWCVRMPMERGKNHGGDAIKWFRPGADAVYARLYVKFSPDYQYNHHFV